MPILALEQTGLTKKETKIYLTSLELGPATVQEIARKAGIHRVTVYDILESLKSRGLVNLTVKAKKKFFVAEDPKKLIDLLKQKEKEVRCQLQKAKDLIPELEAIYKKIGVRPSVKYYEGKEEVKRLYLDQLNYKEIWAYGSVRDMFKTMPYFFESYWKRAAKKKIKFRTIEEQTKATQRFLELIKDTKKETKFFPKNVFLRTDNIIYGDKVAHVALREKLMGVVMESKDIAKSERIVFETMWKSAVILK